MVLIEIPGKGIMEIENLLLDLNGTIATDGVIAPKIKRKINALSQKLKMFILTADTLGNLHETTKGIKADFIKISGQRTGRRKAEVFNHIELRKTAVIGNGFNDHLILKEARLGIAVIGKEGLAVKALLSSDIVVNDIVDALDLFVHPLRIKATLRM